MRRLSVLLFLSFLLLLNRESALIPIHYPQIPPGKSFSPGTKEDPLARFRYEERMLADPSTGRIPISIRKKELDFSRSIPTRHEVAAKSGQRFSQTSFQRAGPNNVGGRTRAAAFDVRNEEIILAGGVSGSLWKTTNGGTSWTQSSNPLQRHSVTSLAQDTRPGKEDTWYLGTGELRGNTARSLAAPYRGIGIYKSVDNGDTWELLDNGASEAPQNFYNQLQYIWRIQTNHLNAAQDEVLVAAFGGILRSTDGGITWDAVLGQNLTNLAATEDLNCSTSPYYSEIQKTSNGTFFAAMSSRSSSFSCEEEVLAEDAGFYYSSDGENWVEITPPDFPEYFERTVIGFSADENQVYFLTHEGIINNEETNQLRRYTISTGTWANLTANIPQFGEPVGDFSTLNNYCMTVAGHPTSNNIIFIGGTNLYRSTTGFTTDDDTDWIGGYSSDNRITPYPSHHPDQHLLLFTPSNPNEMISLNDGGIRKTSNNLEDSIKWSSLNNGYLTSQFYTIAQQHDAPTDAIVGGMQDNGSYLRSGADIESPNWTLILGGDGGYAAITPNQDFIYTSFQEGEVYRLTLNDNKNLTSFARVDPVGAGDDVPVLFVNPYILDPNNASRMYYTGGDVLWKNENLLQIPGNSRNPTSVNWKKISRTTTGALYTSLEKSRTGDTLLAGTYEEYPRIVLVKNASEPGSQGQTFFPDNFPSFGHISCIATNPENAMQYLVVFSNYGIPSIFMTTNGGQSFVDISGNLEENPDGSGSGPSVRWAEVVPTTDGITYFVGTSTGLYSTEIVNGSNTSWVKEDETGIGNAIIPMIDYRPIDGRLIVATHGSGTYRSYIDNFRPLVNQPTPEPSTALTQNFPNPFKNYTTIEYNIPEDGIVKIDLYSAGGKLVKNLLWGPQFAGLSRIIWDGTNTNGIPVRPGIYFYVFNYGSQKISKRIIYQP